LLKSLVYQNAQGIHGEEVRIYLIGYSMKTPDTFKFAETHEWVSFEDDGLAWIGISNHAQEALGDVMFFQAPKVGQGVKQGETIAVIESVKAASDIHAPISGEIMAVNEEMDTTPEIVNVNPYAVWLFKINPRSDETLSAELETLMPLEKYSSSADS
jgi:glycine cleavage system H protein